MDNKKKINDIRNKIKKLALATTLTGISFVGGQASPNNNSAPSSDKTSRIETVRSSTSTDKGNSDSINLHDACGSEYSTQSNSDYAKKLGEKIKALSNDERNNVSPKTPYYHNGVSMTETDEGILTFSYEKPMLGDTIKLDIIYNPNAIIADDTFTIQQDGQKIKDPTYLTPTMIKSELDRVQSHGTINKDYINLVTKQKTNEKFMTSLADIIKKRHPNMVEEDGGIEFFGEHQSREGVSSSSEHIELYDTNHMLGIKYGNDDSEKYVVFDKKNRDFYTSLGGDKITPSEVRMHLENFTRILGKVEGCQINIETNQTAKTISQFEQNTRF